MKKWGDRDTPSSQEKTALLLMYLRVGCDYKILDNGSLKTDTWTIWIEIKLPLDFSAIECGMSYDELDNTDTFYLPTEVRLNQCNGKDWY